MRDSLFSATLAVLPAVCPSCGKYEFYDPEIAEKNEYLAYLMKKDSAENCKTSFFDCQRSFGRV